jgi:transposase-like protein
MDTNEEWGVEDRLQALQETRAKLESIEREWKHWREQSRTLAIELIAIDRLSVAKVAGLSGHHRNTLKVWLDLWNAEHKKRPSTN